MPTSDTETRPARSDGKRLFITQRSGLEDSYAWDGPAGVAHHAVVNETRHNHAFGSQLCVEIEVFDVDNKSLGTLSHEEWS